MNKVLTLLSLVALAAGVTRAADATPAEAPAKTAATAPDTLHSLMKAMGRDFKALIKNLGDPSQVDANRALVKNLVANAEKSSAFTPEKITKQPAGEQPDLEKDYKADLVKLIADLKKIDAALVKKDFDAAKDAVAACKAEMKAGHKAFIEKK